MESADNKFIQLLRISVLRQYIFQYLPLKVMYGLRGVSSEIKLLIDEVYLPSELRVIHMKPLPMFTNGLTTFLMNGCYDEEGFKILSTKARSLRALNLLSCDWLTDDLLIDTLQSNPYLNKLNISYCTDLSPFAFYSIIVHGSNVTALNIIGCNFRLLNLKAIELEEFEFKELELSTDFYETPYLGKLLRRSKNLRILSLHFDEYNEFDPFKFHKLIRTQEHILEALENCKNLKMLILMHGHDITDEVLNGFSNLTHCKNIQCLSLIKCIDFTYRGLKAIRNFKNLKQLILDFSSGITAKDFRYLTVCEHIQILTLINCWWVDDSVLEVISHYRNLKRLNLLSKSNVHYTSAGLSGVVNGCTDLIEVFLSGTCHHFPLPRDCFQLKKVVIHIVEELPHSSGQLPTCKAHGRQANIIINID